MALRSTIVKLHLEWAYMGSRRSNTVASMINLEVFYARVQSRLSVLSPIYIMLIMFVLTTSPLTAHISLWKITAARVVRAMDSAIIDSFGVILIGV